MPARKGQAMDHDVPAAVAGAAAPGQRLPGDAGHPRRRRARHRRPPGRRPALQRRPRRGHGTHPERSTGCCAPSPASASSARRRSAASPSPTSAPACAPTRRTRSAGWAAFVGEPYHWQAWSALLHSVRTGENAFRHVHGTDPWTFRARHPELSAGFDRAMTDLSRQRQRRDPGRLRLRPLRAARRRRRRERRASWPPSSPSTRRCAASSSTSRTSSAGPGRSWRRRAWPTAARSSAAASSRRSRRGATPTSSRRSSTTGRTRPASRSCGPAAGRWRTGLRCWSSSASSVGPTRTRTPSSPTSTCWWGRWARSARPSRVRRPLHRGRVPVRRLHPECGRDGRLRRYRRLNGRSGTPETWQPVAKLLRVLLISTRSTSVVSC